jgi:hypothetical protein
MKATILCLCLLLFFTIGFSQKDSLQLKLSYEIVARDAKVPLNIRIDFISLKTIPITFQNEPEYMLHCNLDDLRLQEEVLEGDCYKAVAKSDCAPIAGLSPKKNNIIQLQYGDTATYRDYIYLHDKEKVYQRQKGFKGNYRFRVSRFYLESGQRRQTFSNWLYVNYPN